MRKNIQKILLISFRGNLTLFCFAIDFHNVIKKSRNDVQLNVSSVIIASH